MLNSVGSVNGIQTNINNMVGCQLSETFSEINNVNNTITTEGGTEADKLTNHPTLENIYKTLLKIKTNESTQELTLPTLPLWKDFKVFHVEQIYFNNYGMYALFINYNKDNMLVIFFEYNNFFTGGMPIALKFYNDPEHTALINSVNLWDDNDPANISDVVISHPKIFSHQFKHYLDDGLGFMAYLIKTDYIGAMTYIGINDNNPFDCSQWEYTGDFTWLDDSCIYAPLQFDDYVVKNVRPAMSACNGNSEVDRENYQTCLTGLENLHGYNDISTPTGLISDPYNYNGVDLTIACFVYYSRMYGGLYFTLHGVSETGLPVNKYIYRLL